MRRWSLIVWAVVAGLVGMLMYGLCMSMMIPPTGMTGITLGNLRRAIYTSARRSGRVPTSLEGLPPTTDGHAQVTTDGWGRPITLRIEPDGQVTLISLGADGLPGGTGTDRDWIGTFDPRGRSDNWTRDPFGRPATRP